MAQTDQKKEKTVSINGRIVGETQTHYRFSDGLVTGWFRKADVKWEEGFMEMPEYLAMEMGFIHGG